MAKKKSLIDAAGAPAVKESRPPERQKKVIAAPVRRPAASNILGALIVGFIGGFLTGRFLRL